MTFVHTLIFALVEGVTEFLPISSTAHLIITSKLLGITQNPVVSLFEVVIQSGAILAVVVLYWSTFVSFLSTQRRLLYMLVLSFMPTALAGLAFHKTIKEVFFHADTLIASSLIGVGILFIAVESLIARKVVTLSRDMHALSMTHALLIGIMQATAIVPGVSRAGAVMLGMMMLGYKRTDSALYSFLLAVPTLLAAGAYDLLKTDTSLLTSDVVQTLAIGGFLSCVAAYACLRWLIAYLQHNTLTIFGYYRIVAGILFFIFTQIV